MTPWALDGGAASLAPPCGLTLAPASVLAVVRAPHQTSHLWWGFMGEPSGQWKCSENSFELDTEPMTRKREGLWGSVMRPSWMLSGVRTEHQTFVRVTRERPGSL